MRKIERDGHLDPCNGCICPEKTLKTIFRANKPKMKAIIEEQTGGA
jgi:hypothetical protein